MGELLMLLDPMVILCDVTALVMCEMVNEN
jgi:hypothetical protein